MTVRDDLAEAARAHIAAFKDEMEEHGFPFNFALRESFAALERAATPDGPRDTLAEMIETAIGHADRVRVLTSEPDGAPADSGRIYDSATECINALDDVLWKLRDENPTAAPVGTLPDASEKEQ